MLMSIGVAIVLGGFVATAARAQAPAATETSTQITAQDNEVTFWKLYKQGGWAMVPITLLSVAGVGLTVYGFLSVRTEKMLSPQLVSQLQTSLDGLNIEEAANLCAGSPSLLTNILQAGLQRISDGVLDVPSMEKAMEEASIEESAAGLKPINYLSIIAQIAPMLGLLGTVSGMIKAFQKIGMGGMGDPEKLAADIGEAMITTGAGLVVGIPSMFFYFYLKGTYLTNMSRLSRMLGNLAHALVVASRRAGAEQA
jgi:biopolymer transport protein ExbB